MHRITQIDYKCATGTPVAPKIGAKSHEMCQKHAWLCEALTHLIFIEDAPEKTTGFWDAYL